MLASKKIRTYIWYGYKEYVTYNLNLFSNLMYNTVCFVRSKTMLKFSKN